MALTLRLSSLVISLGWGDAVTFVMARVLQTVFAGRVRLVKYYFVAQPVVQPDQALIRRATPFVFEWIGPESELFAQVERPASVIADRFAQGARCLAARTAGGELAGFLWYVVGPYCEDEVRAVFWPAPAGRVAWDFDVTIMPRYRLGRLFSYLWARASVEMAASGIEYTVSRISAFNAGSLRSHGRLGARTAGAAIFLCAGHWQLTTSTLKPWLHLSRSRETRFELTVSP